MSKTIKRNDYPRGERMPRRRREAAPDLFSLRCQECGRPLVRTTSGYLACDRGHGGLQIDLEAVPEAETFRMFIDSEFDSAA